MNSIGIGLVGYGMIGRVHALAYRDLPIFHPGSLPPIRLAAVCTSHPETARNAADEAGFNGWCTEISELVGRQDVDVIDCCVPNYLHRPVLLAAITAGKHVLCEKPLALNREEAQEIMNAARRADVRVGLIFNCRFIPALMRAKQMIDAGVLGQVYHFSAAYLHAGYQDPDRPMAWKLRHSQAGGGAWVDLGSHIIDLVRYLLGDYAAVQCTTHTYVRERPTGRGSDAREPVNVDDAAWVQARLQSGAIGMLHVSRFATGTLDDLRLEIYGRRAALRFDLMDPNWLYFYDGSVTDKPIGGQRGWTRVETVARYPGAAAPPQRSPLGWSRTHAENTFAFLKALVAGEEPVPGLLDGLRVHEVIDAGYASAAEGGWQEITLS